MNRPWAAYLSEAMGLAVFMAFAGALTVLLFHPDSAVGRALGEPPARYFALGLGMAPVVWFGIVDAPWGKRSGAHVNPAVTLAFWRLGKISGTDALFYVAFQFLGAIAIARVMGWIFGPLYTHPAVDFAGTKPGPEGLLVAFGVEFAISFGMMALTLWMANDERLEKRAGGAMALLLGFYLVVATPLTGMSLNPARTTGSAVWASERPGLWIYFVAPCLATLLAAELYRRLWPGRQGGKSYPPEG